METPIMALANLGLSLDRVFSFSWALQCSAVQTDVQIAVLRCSAVLCIAKCSAGESNTLPPASQTTARTNVKQALKALITASDCLRLTSTTLQNTPPHPTPPYPTSSHPHHTPPRPTPPHPTSPHPTPPHPTPTPLHPTPPHPTPPQVTANHLR